MIAATELPPAYSVVSTPVCARAMRVLQLSSEHTVSFVPWYRNTGEKLPHLLELRPPQHEERVVPSAEHCLLENPQHA